MPRMRRVRQRLNFSTNDEDSGCRGTEEELSFLPCPTTSEDFPECEKYESDRRDHVLSSVKSPALFPAVLRDARTLRSSSSFSHRHVSPSHQHPAPSRSFRKSHNVINSLHAPIPCIYSVCFIVMVISRILLIPKYHLFVFQSKRDHSVQKRENLHSSVTPESEIKRCGININPFTPDSLLIQTLRAKRNRNRFHQKE